MASRSRKAKRSINREASELIQALKLELDCETDVDLAEFLDVSTSSLSRWRMSGLPKAVKSLILLNLDREYPITSLLLERLKKHLSCRTDRELALTIGVKESGIAGWRHKEFPEFVVKILDHLLPPLDGTEMSYEDRFSGQPCVYFVQSAETGRVKIGYTQNLKKRLSKMQTDSSELLKVLFAFAPLPQEEKGLHSAFAEHRFHGEWFDLTPELLEFIEEQKQEEDQFN